MVWHWTANYIYSLMPAFHNDGIPDNNFPRIESLDRSHVIERSGRNFARPWCFGSRRSDEAVEAPSPRE